MTLTRNRLGEVLVAFLVSLVFACCLAVLPANSDVAHAATAPAKAKITKISASYAKVNVTWDGVKGASGYQVRISKHSTMTNAKKYTVKNAKARSKRIAGASSYTKYFVQVRAYKVIKGKKHFGAWSKVRRCTTKNKVNHWTWSQLKRISNRISACDSRAEAYRVAKHYGILRSDGKLTGKETKTIKLSDGRVCKVRVIGIYHDNKAKGGKAGLTFEFKGLVDNRKLNGSDTNKGGWRDSNLRAWLNDTMYYKLPASLRSAITPVKKRTNNVGKTSSVKSVTTTKDKLWLPSVVELTGEPFISYRNNPNPAEILSAEGTQYKLYKDRHSGFAVDGGVPPSPHHVFIPDSVIKKPDSWWLRSPQPITNDSFFLIPDVTYEGNIAEFWPHYAYGVSPCFCV